MIDLSEIANLKELFQQMCNAKESVYISFNGLDKNSVEGIITRVADDFVEIRHRYSQFICPYSAIRLVTIGE